MAAGSIDYIIRPYRPGEENYVAEADYYRTTEENADAHLEQAIEEGWTEKM